MLSAKNLIFQITNSLFVSRASCAGVGFSGRSCGARKGQEKGLQSLREDAKDAKEPLTPHSLQAVLIELLQLDSSMCTSPRPGLVSSACCLGPGWAKEERKGKRRRTEERAGKSHEKYSKPALFSHFINFSFSLLVSLPCLWSAQFQLRSPFHRPLHSSSPDTIPPLYHSAFLPLKGKRHRPLCSGRMEH